MFLVASTIEEANEYKDMLAGPNLLGDPDQILLVTSEEPDKTLALLDTLEEPNSPIRAVVSVSMLKEGWDVKNIYVISSVRSMESELLTEQILGRGLRLPFGDAPATPCSTPSRSSPTTLRCPAQAGPRPPRRDPGRPCRRSHRRRQPGHRQARPRSRAHPHRGSAHRAIPDSGEVQFHLPGAAAADPDQLGLFEADETLGSREAASPPTWASASPPWTPASQPQPKRKLF